MSTKEAPPTAITTATPDEAPATPAPDATATSSAAPAKKVQEIGGPKGPEPTRYGDWERDGRCVDF